MKPNRFEFWKEYKEVLFNYNIQYDSWYSTTLSKSFHGYNWNFIRIGIDNKFMRIEDLYYDGHTYKGITFCYIALGYGFTMNDEEQN